MNLLKRVAAAILVLSAGCAGEAPGDYPFHGDPAKLVVTRAGKVVTTLPCERVPLDGKERWGQMGGHGVAYIRAHIGQTSDGQLYAQVGGCWGAYWVVSSARNVMYESMDLGKTWTSWNLDLPNGRIIGEFAVLNDDTFLVGATQDGDNCVSYYSSSDRGRTWTLISELRPDPFVRTTIGGNITQLADGTILSVVHYSVPTPEGVHFSQGVYAGYVRRSTDGGRTWSAGPDPKFWKAVIDARLLVAPTGPAAKIPGPGGTFPGTFEIGLSQDATGRVLGAMRFSGPQWPWHKRIMVEWGGRPADDAGRIFRQVMSSNSTDGGLTWTPLRPFTDAHGVPVIVQQETNGQLVPLPDGRVVLVHQRRFGPFETIARVSLDGGETWLHDEYRLSAGFGFSDSVLLADGTIVTVLGKSIGGKSGAQAIRWRLPSMAQLREHAKQQPEPSPEFLAQLPVYQGFSVAGVGTLDKALTVKQYHTYTMRLTRADPKQLSPDDLLEVFVDDKKVGQAKRRQLPKSEFKYVLFGDNDTSSPDEVRTSARYHLVTFVPGDGKTPGALAYLADEERASPSEQGWKRIRHAGGGKENLHRADGGQAWQLTTNANGAIRYRRPLGPVQFADPGGWTLTARFHVVDQANPGSCTVLVRDGRNTFAMSLGQKPR